LGEVLQIPHNYKEIAAMQKKEAAAINRQLKEVKRKNEALKKIIKGGKTV
jgi:hypothetical protein